jgi:oligogalacturonide lyase
MRKGARFAAEGSWHMDRATGARVRQLTCSASISHPTYFLHSAFVPGDREIFFTSYRSGPPQLFLAGYPDGEILQLTGGAPVHPFSALLAPNGEEIVFTRGCEIWVLRLRSLDERRIFAMNEGQLGECSISSDGEWLTAAFQSGGRRGLVAGRTDGTLWREILFPRTVIHPQFHPLEPQWIEFSGDPAPRMHRVKRDGTGMECLYEHSNEEFVVHETFLGRTGDLVFTVWPRLLARMDWTTREISTIAEFNAWHIAPNRAGTEILCDTNHPDRGLHIVDVATGVHRMVCLTEASNQGSQWTRSRYALAGDFAAAHSQAAGSARVLSWMEAPVDTVYGPQWTHPHPSWSSDESKAAFASDRTGTTQVYVVEL